MTEKSVKITCNEPEFKEIRLDKFLFSRFPEYSRSYFQKLVNNNHIHVNQKIITKSSHSLKPNDIISITFAPTHEFNLTPQKVDFQIIDSNEDFWVINKPIGLAVHNTTTNAHEPSLVNGLLYHFEELHTFEDKERPGIIHRLDKDTSGLILVARNIPAQIQLSKMFKDRAMHKTYLAVVRGHPDRSGTIDYPIGRHPTQRHKMSHRGICSREAFTEYSVQAYFMVQNANKICSSSRSEQFALVEAKPVTGRTHQIRVHLAAIGHGILGDQTYGLASHLIKRQALHAWQISFTYKGKEFSYTAPLPEDFTTLLEALKLDTDT